MEQKKTLKEHLNKRLEYFYKCLKLDDNEYLTDDELYQYRTRILLIIDELEEVKEICENRKRY